MVVGGTRPEAIKLSPVVERLESLGADYLFVWSGQHYDYEMSRIFFDQLNLRKPDRNLDVGSGSHAEQTARAMVAIERAIRDYGPSIVAAEGDTNTVAAAALTSIKCLVPFAHIEAGLRSWNMTMPEEVNRKVADSISTLHFAPTKLAALNLLLEGVPTGGLHLTGNTIVDVIRKHSRLTGELSGRLLSELGLEEGGYMLITIHRAENTDNPERLRRIAAGLRELSGRFRVVFPIHPRTRERLAGLGLEGCLSGITTLGPMGYFEFLALLANCLTVLTDSGGVQEEAFTLRIPTVTIRNETERPETLTKGVNVLAGTETRRIVDTACRQAESYSRIRSLKIANPLGDGNAGRRIAEILVSSASSNLAVSEHEPGNMIPLKSKRVDSQLMRAFNIRNSGA